MPTYQHFKDLPVWRTAAQLYKQCDEFLATASRAMRPSFQNQLERAVLSVSNNIAEGFERGTTKELLAFIYIARGSAGEVQSMLILLSGQSGVSNFKSQISNMLELAESCSRQLRAWADALQNSAIAGQRHLNEQTRSDFQKSRSREEGEEKFQTMLAQTLPQGHPARAREMTSSQKRR